MLSIIGNLLYPELLWIYQTGERWRLWLYLHDTTVERQTPNHHQSSHEVFSLALPGSQTSSRVEGKSYQKGLTSLPCWRGSEAEIFPNSWQLYSCGCACQTSVWNSLFWLGEGVSFIRWWASWGVPKEKETLWCVVSLSKNLCCPSRVRAAACCSGYGEYSLCKYTQYR